MWISQWWPCPSYNQISSYTDLEQSGIIEPVTIQECKDYMRLEGWEESEATEFSFDDDLIAELIQAARKYIEELASVSLVPHEYEVILTNAGRIELPFSPIDEVESVLDQDDNDLTDNIKVAGNNRKYLKAPTGYDLKVTYTTSILPDTRPLMDIKILVWAMYNAHTTDPATVWDKVSLFISSYSRKSPLA